jgi:uncharacterized membrane protein
MEVMDMRKNTGYKVIVNKDNIPEFNLESNEFTFDNVNDAIGFLAQNNMVTNIWSNIIKSRDNIIVTGQLDKSNWYELRKYAG